MANLLLPSNDNTNFYSKASKFYVTYSQWETNWIFTVCVGVYLFDCIFKKRQATVNTIGKERENTMVAFRTPGWSQVFHVGTSKKKNWNYFFFYEYSRRGEFTVFIILELTPSFNKIDHSHFPVTLFSWPLKKSQSVLHLNFLFLILSHLVDSFPFLKGWFAAVLQHPTSLSSLTS